MPAFAEMFGAAAINDMVNYLATGHAVADTAATKPNVPQVPEQRRPDLSGSRRISRNRSSVGHPERDRP